MQTSITIPSSITLAISISTINASIVEEVAAAHGLDK